MTLLWPAARVLVAALALPAAAAAQATRAEIIAQAQAEKAAAMPVDPPGLVERTVVGIRRAAIESPSGPYPIVDSVYLGGGPTAGAGYRQYVGDRTVAKVRGLYSVKDYKALEGHLLSPGHRRDTVDLAATVAWMDATQIGFHGLGMDAGIDDRANFRQRQTTVGGEATLRPRRPWALSAALAGERFVLGPGRGREPSIEEVYDAGDAPGLGSSPTYAHSMLSAGYDRRPAAGYARRGGAYTLRYHRYDRGGSGGFDRVDVDLVQHVPLRRETWVLSGHARLQSTVGGDVPYFLLPALGGGSTLRGYSSWRFRDRHALLMQGEFRWVPNLLGMDMAIFWDGGTVAAARGDLAWSRVVHDVGVGVRLHTPAQTPIRVELARGDEGLRLVMAAKAVF
jgi:hypothetical protein